jgi:glycosyltransferase involved in cell wall biosynthesis
MVTDLQSNLPSLSIIIVSLNCESVIRECLNRIISQNYPNKLIEILLIDGGSVDKTLDIAKEYPVNIINAGYPENQEARRSIGLTLAKNNILVYIDMDNFLPDKEWLLDMVRPFLEDDRIFATQTLRYTYVQKDTALNRYFALFGVNDPIPYYFNKRDRLSWAESKWALPGTVIKETEKYYVVEFNIKRFSTMGCNGFLIKKEVLLQSKHSHETFFHTDVLYDLLEKGFNRYGIVKTSIWHVTGSTFFSSLKKRYVYMQVHYQKMGPQRRYKIYDSRKMIDNLQLFKYIFYTLTFIKPLYDSFRGFIKIRDIAWFLHPFICFSFFVVYVFSFIKNKIKG